MKNKKTSVRGIKNLLSKQLVDRRYLTVNEEKEAEEEGWSRITSNLKRKLVRLESERRR